MFLHIWHFGSIQGHTVCWVFRVLSMVGFCNIQTAFYSNHQQMKQVFWVLLETFVDLDAKALFTLFCVKEFLCPRWSEQMFIPPCPQWKWMVYVWSQKKKKQTKKTTNTYIVIVDCNNFMLLMWWLKMVSVLLLFLWLCLFKWNKKIKSHVVLVLVVSDWTLKQSVNNQTKLKECMIKVAQVLKYVTL